MFAKKKKKKIEKAIHFMGFGWRLLLRSKELKFGSWCTTRESKSFNDWAFCTSLLVPDHPRGQRAGIEPAVCCHGSLIREVALCTDKSGEPRFCCCSARGAHGHLSYKPQLNHLHEYLSYLTLKAGSVRRIPHKNLGQTWGILKYGRSPPNNSFQVSVTFARCDI